MTQVSPYQTLPYPGSYWHSDGQPGRLPHDEYVRVGAAPKVTPFQLTSGQVRVKGGAAAPTGCSISGARLSWRLSWSPFRSRNCC